MLCLLFDVLRDCWTAKLRVIVHHLCLGQSEISCMGIFTTKLLCLSVICSSVGLPFVGCFFVWEDREGLRKGGLDFDTCMGIFTTKLVFCVYYLMFCGIGKWFVFGFYHWRELPQVSFLSR